jgi:hypothetical protein
LLSRKKIPPTDGWGFNDEEFEEINITCIFTLEGCCDPLGFNCHRDLPFYFENNSILGHDISKQYIYYNTPWSLSIKSVEYLRACHSKSPLDTKAIIVLPDWLKFKAVTKELKFIKRLPKGENVFMRNFPICTYDPPDRIPSA